jgi:hypothetical protein
MDIAAPMNAQKIPVMRNCRPMILWSVLKM